MRHFYTAISFGLLTVGCFSNVSDEECTDWLCGEFVPFIDDGEVGESPLGKEELSRGGVSSGNQGLNEEVISIEVEGEGLNEILPAEHYARKELTDVELAEALRAITPGPDGRAYISKDINYKSAKDALAMDPLKPLLFEGEEARSLGGKMHSQIIFGSDDRVKPPQTSPYKWMVRIQSNFGSCSGVWIGHHTILTAAHCVYDPLTNQFSTGNSFMTYTDGEFWYMKNKDVSGRIVIPASYDNNTGVGDPRWDFAVVNVKGLYQSPTGWNGFIVNHSGDRYGLYGYGHGCTNLCGMKGSGYVNDYRIESSEIDASGGTSGAPWLASSNHTVGVLRGGRTYFDFVRCGFSLCKRNYGRRLDSVVWSFVQAHSEDW